MSRLVFRLQPIPTASGSTVRLDTASGSNTPADVRTLGGNVIDGAIVRSGPHAGGLPSVLGPDGVTTLYQKTLDYRGQVVDSPVTLTGEDDNPSAPSVAGMSALVLARQARTSTLRGAPCAIGANASLHATSNATVGTGRAPFYIPAAVTDLRLTYANWRISNASTNGQDLDGTADLVLKASVEYSGTIYPVTFNGALTVTVNPGGLMQSDALGIDVPAGATIYARTYTSGSAWYAPRVIYYSNSGGGFTATTDLTPAGSAAIPDATGFTYVPAPVSIAGTPLSATARPSVLAVGDSTAQGSGDGITTWNVQRHATNLALGGGGWLARACYSAGLGLQQLALNGDQVTNFVQNAAHFRRATLATSCSTAVVLFGRNDITNGRTDVQVKADLINAWSMLANRGLRVIACTVTPRSSSTDGWRTLGNQTASTGDAFRVAVNDWMRDGAPILAGAAAAIGSSATGTVRFGDSAHPAFGYFETADKFESSRNSGLWKTATVGRTLTDVAATAASSSITSATGAFTAADVGKVLIINGAGTAGGTYVTLISQVLNGTTVTCLAYSQPATTVTGATAYITDGYTLDGLHGTPLAQAGMATAFDTSKVI